MKILKRVLVTGSQGFIGSYVCNELLQNNYHVIGVDNFQNMVMLQEHMMKTKISP